ncbi:MAG: zinc metallopeptidase [Anaerolineales bacterium]|jgi:Zn-dependent membrane protease YugP
MFWFDPIFLLISLPALILGFYAQMKVRSAFQKYSKVRSWSGMTGAEAARRILDQNGLYNVKIEPTRGMLSDHYDPRSKTLRLSPDVYQSNSLAAVGVAAHESGHAIQDKQGYTALAVRSAMVPTVQLGSWLGPIVFIAGFLMLQMTNSALGLSIAWIGLGLFAATALFAIVTLPVEFDASKRAKQLLVEIGVISHNELKGVNSVLDAAALTYVAGAIQAVSTLLYYAFLLFGARRD